MKAGVYILGFVLLNLFAGRPLAAAGTIELKQHWLAGKKYYQTIQTEQQSTFVLDDDKTEETTRTIIELTMTLGRQQAGQPKRMTIRYERMALEVSANGETLGYDSAKPEAGTDPLNLRSSIGAVVGQELKVVFNEQDEIAQIENYDEFLRHVAPSAGTDFDPAEMFSREALTEMLQQGELQGVPGKPVTVGDSWPFRSQAELPQTGKISLTGTCTLAAIGEYQGVKCARIQTTGAITMELGGAPAGGPGVKPTQGAIQGTLWFDPALGITRDSQLVQEMAISLKDPADPTATVEVPMKQTISVKITRVEDVK